MSQDNSMNKDTDGGLQPGRDPDDIDAAQAALNRMREAAAARGEIRRKAARRGPARAAKNRHAASGAPAASASSTAPAGIRWAWAKSWDASWPNAAGARRWPSAPSWRSGPALVGPEISAHCTPESFTDTTLHVRCDSTAWATQLRLLSISLLEKFRTELGDGVVTSIQVLGPAAPSWRKGLRTVNGRGPRDTYG